MMRNKIPVGVLGAAGAATLNAELMMARGYLQ
jgi:hypothetical protein